MTRTLVALCHLIVLTILAQPMMILAQSVTARGETLPVRAEPPKVSNTIPVTHAFERRHQTPPQDQRELWKQKGERQELLEAQIAVQARARANARARARVETLEATLKQKYNSLQDISRNPTQHRFEDWDTSSDDVIGTAQELVACGLRRYEGLIVHLRESAVLRYTRRLNALCHGKQLQYRVSPGDETQTTGDMIPSVIVRMSALLRMGPDYHPLQAQEEILLDLSGRPRDDKTAETIQGVLRSVQGMINACRTRRGGVTDSVGARIV